MTAARVIGTVSGHGADLFALGDPIEQIRQDRAVTVAAGREFHGPDVRGGCVHGQMNLAPLTTALNAMLARLPLAVVSRIWWKFCGSVLRVG
jgi:hypothetical protein